MTLTILLAGLCGALRLSEVMPDPASVEDAHGEFVELQARGAAVDLNGFRLALPGGDTVALPRRTLEPGTFWVLGRVFAPDNGGFVPDSALPTGWSLPNATGRIALLDGAGREVDAMTWDRSTSGRSLEICPDGLWKASTGIFGLGDHGTPGTPNSCDDSPLALEGAVTSFVRRLDTLESDILNRGVESWTSRVVDWSRDGEVVHRDTVDLAPGAHRVLRIGLGSFASDRSRWVVRLPRDGRPSDDSLALWVKEPKGNVVVSEIQPADPGPEWIEIAQGLATTFSVGGWTIGDQEPRGRIPFDASVPASGRLVLSPDCPALRAQVGISTLPCAEPVPWPRLSVEEDRVALRDADGSLWDSVAWTKAGGAWPKGRTRERQDLSEFGSVDQWLPSGVVGGTPGYGPEAAEGWNDGLDGAHAFRIASRRVRIGDPDHPLRMETTMPSEEELRVDLYDMGRRAVLRIHEGPPPRRGILLWDGRDARGRDLKPGVYVVVVESGPARKPVWKAREWIVVAPRP